MNQTTEWQFYWLEHHKPLTFNHSYASMN